MRFTVGELRRAIEGMPDDSPVLVRPKSYLEWEQSWLYQTREVSGAYHASDDRYGQNEVLLIQLADKA